MIIFSGLFRKDFVNIRNRFSLQETVQIHHIIPLEWKNHKKLINYNINEGYNLIFLPNKKGKEILNTNRRIHDGGHPNYNKYVLERLNEIKDPHELSLELRLSLINNEEIPW